MVLVLLAGTVQCASACTPVSFTHPLPPCHRHGTQKTACAQELVAAPAGQPPVVHLMPAAGSFFDSGMRTAAPVLLAAPAPLTASPPLLKSAVLRI